MAVWIDQPKNLGGNGNTFLLQENSFFLLLESGFKIILNTGPVVVTWTDQTEN